MSWQVKTPALRRDMRNFRVHITCAVLLALVAIWVMGCSPPPPKFEDFRGKWIAVKKENYKLGGGQQVGFEIEFFDNKTVKMPYGLASWDIMPDGRIKMEVPRVIMYGSLKENILTITMPDDQGKVIFKKQ